MERRTRKTPEEFATWLRDQLIRRGYDLGIRGGGRTKFADESGIGRATVTRILRGESATDTQVLEKIAATLGVPFGQVLIEAGVVTPDQLGAAQHPERGPRRITPEQAADELGIEDAQARRLFVSMTETLQRTPPPETGEGRLAQP
ncbi:helix-turn-helix domain-containing protein [Streptomyces sp. NPDC054796]